LWQQFVEGPLTASVPVTYLHTTWKYVGSTLWCWICPKPKMFNLCQNVYFCAVFTYSFFSSVGTHPVCGYAGKKSEMCFLHCHIFHSSQIETVWPLSKNGPHFMLI
jgi:hypothetical protein